MTIPETSPLFATVGTYPIDGDPWEGDPVRVDPGASRRAEGFEPDTLPAEWANFMTGIHGDWIEMLRRKRLATSLATWTERVPASDFPIKAIATQPAPTLVTSPGASFPSVPTLPVDHALIVVQSGGGDTIHATSDGSVFTASNTGITALVQDVAYLPIANRWIAVGGTTNGTIFSRVAGNLATSWTSVYGPTLAYFTRVACSGTRAIAIGIGGRVVTSTNGVSWSATTALAAEATDITYGGGLFVAVYRDTIYTSTDGSVWTTRHTTPALSDFAASRVAYDSTRARFFVTSNTNGSTRIRSFLASDPDTFFPPIAFAQAINDLAVVNGVLALVSGNHVRFSDDAGASFSYAYTGPTAAIGKVVAASPVLNCLFIGGDDGGSNGFLTQSLRGL